MSRRQALKMGVVLAGAAWVAPVVKPIALTSGSAAQASSLTAPGGTGSGSSRSGSDESGDGGSGRSSSAVPPSTASPARYIALTGQVSDADPGRNGISGTAMMAAASGRDPTRRLGPPAEGVVAREVKGCFALLCPSRGQVIVLNETASDVWRLADGESTLGLVVDRLAYAYGVEAEAIRDQVASTVESLEEFGALARPA